MVCDFCLKPAESPGCCFDCFGYVLRPLVRGDEYAKQLHDTAIVQKAVRLAGGIRPWIRAWRRRHEQQFPRLQAVVDASDRDVQRFCSDLALLGGALRTTITTDERTAS